MDWVEVFGNYVFPIAMCIYLLFENREQRKTHKEETNNLAQVIEANTLAIVKLSDKMEKE